MYKRKRTHLLSVCDLVTALGVWFGLGTGVNLLNLSEGRRGWAASRASAHTFHNQPSLPLPLCYPCLPRLLTYTTYPSTKVHSVVASKYLPALHSDCSCSLHQPNCPADWINFLDASFPGKGWSLEWSRLGGVAGRPGVLPVPCTRGPTNWERWKRRG